jgi:hypothetical protein
LAAAAFMPLLPSDGPPSSPKNPNSNASHNIVVPYPNVAPLAARGNNDPNAAPTNDALIANSNSDARANPIPPPPPSPPPP